jgi:hypothetical protein
MTCRPSLMRLCRTSGPPLRSSLRSGKGAWWFGGTRLLARVADCHGLANAAG